MKINKLVILIISLLALLGCSDMGDPLILQPDVELDTSLVDFGQVSLGHEQNRSLIVINKGEGTLNVDLALDQDSSAFSLLSAPSISVDAADTAMIDLKFMPGSATTYTGTLTLVSNDLEQPEMIIMLTGTGVDAQVPGISLSHTSLNYGSVLTSSITIAQVTIISSGTDTLVVDSLSFGDPSFSTDVATPFNLAPGSSVQIDVRFQTTTAGSYNADLSIYSNTATSPSMVQLSAEAAVAVSYASSIQPVLDANCSGCHGSSGGLNLSSYSQLMSGGNSGSVVTPGDGANSLVVQRLRGIGGSRMPLNGDALSDANIEMTESWIDQGALDN